MAGGKVRNEELSSSQSSPDIIRTIKSMNMRWAGHVARMGEVRDAYSLVGNTEGKIPLRRLGRKWEDDIKMDIKDIGFEMKTGFNWFTTRSNGDLL
jgi:hypothetical protein